jgi:hypothetical protein
MPTHIRTVSILSLAIVLAAAQTSLAIERHTRGRRPLSPPRPPPALNDTQQVARAHQAPAADLNASGGDSPSDQFAEPVAPGDEHPTPFDGDEADGDVVWEESAPVMSNGPRHCNICGEGQICCHGCCNSCDSGYDVGPDCGCNNGACGNGYCNGGCGCDGGCFGGIFSTAPYQCGPKPSLWDTYCLPGGDGPWCNRVFAGPPCPGMGCGNEGCLDGGCGGGCCNDGCAGDICYGDGCCNDGCCNDPCGGDCGDCCPRAYFRADALFLWRSNGDRVNFTSREPGGPIVLSSDNIKFQYEPLTRFAMGRTIGCGAVLEAVYFGIEGWSDSASVSDGGNTLYSAYSQFGQEPFGGYPDTDQSSRQEIQYGSRVHNVELNLYSPIRTWCCGKSWFLNGARYFQLREGFEYNTFSDVDDSATSIRTNNALIGYQFGIRHEAPLGCRLKALFDLKAGIYGNAASQRTVTSAVVEGVLVEQASNTSAAFLGEVGLTLQYDVTRHVALRAGYNMLWVDSVALAPENFLAVPPPGNVLRPILINDDGDVFYHGCNTGLELHW